MLLKELRVYFLNWYDPARFLLHIFLTVPRQPDPNAFANKPSLQHIPGSDHRNAAEIELGYIEEKLRLIQMSLEILTGVCAKLPDLEPVAEEDIPGTDFVTLAKPRLLTYFY